MRNSKSEIRNSAERHRKERSGEVCVTRFSNFEFRISASTQPVAAAAKEINQAEVPEDLELLADLGAVKSQKAVAFPTKDANWAMGALVLGPSSDAILEKWAPRQPFQPVNSERAVC